MVLAPVASAAQAVTPLPLQGSPVRTTAPRASSFAAASPGAQKGPPASSPSSASFDVEPTSPAQRVAANAPSGDLTLYRRAHELHFGGADEGRALAAWDAYLHTFPRGTFAPEARLNRAVCLAKLGRKTEAEGVLVDIERGRFGSDGRRQARKILGALDDD